MSETRLIKILIRCHSRCKSTSNIQLSCLRGCIVESRALKATNVIQIGPSGWIFKTLSRWRNRKEGTASLLRVRRHILAVGTFRDLTTSSRLTLPWARYTRRPEGPCFASAGSKTLAWCSHMKGRVHADPKRRKSCRAKGLTRARYFRAF